MSWSWYEAPAGVYDPLTGCVKCAGCGEKIAVSAPGVMASREAMKSCACTAYDTQPHDTTSDSKSGKDA